MMVIILVHSGGRRLVCLINNLVLDTNPRALSANVP
jgi:hypothetical protein